jgi:hypothetical protein
MPNKAWSKMIVHHTKSDWPLAGTGSLRDVTGAHTLTLGESWEVLQKEWQARSAQERDQRRRIEQRKQRDERRGARLQDAEPTHVVRPIEKEVFVSRAPSLVSPTLLTQQLPCPSLECHQNHRR